MLSLYSAVVYVAQSGYLRLDLKGRKTVNYLLKGLLCAIAVVHTTFLDGIQCASRFHILTCY